MKFNVGHDVLPHEYKGTVYNHDSVGRLQFLRFAFAFVFGVFVIRTLQLGLQQSRMGIGGTQSAEIERRADIVDRNGVVLAKSVKYGHIKLFPRKVKNKYIDSVANLIHEIAPSDYSVADALRIIQSKKDGVYIKKNATEDQIKIIKEAHLKYDCFEIEEKTARRYPHRNVFAHVVGFAGKDKGLEGIENTYDKYLRENKDPLRISIDSRIQNIFHEQLSIAMEKYHAKSAMGMLMNSSTGEMIAMVQLPDFDPNNINSVPADTRKFKLMRDNFEMGSVFKIFNTVLAFENELDDIEYKVNEPLMLYDKFGHPAMSKPIDDVASFKKKGFKKLKAPDIMLYSCNVGSARIALDLPDNAQKDFFHKLNFDRALDLQFGKTERPLIQKVWGKVEKATVGFGHGISVTPMHLLLAVNAVTNGGIYIQPTLLKRSIGAVRGERIIDSEISSKIRNIMFNIAEKTTAQKARVPGMEIGGKTGTAEKRVNGVVDKHKNVTVFAGIFPVSAPQYVIIVIIDEPKATKETAGQRTAAWNAVPTAGAILNGIMPLLF